jgi:hypothetical protein
VAPTRKLLSLSVGKGQKNIKNDVRVLQQLLLAAGEDVPGGDDGGWGDKTAGALASFQKKNITSGAKLSDSVDSEDDCLLLLAWKADILIPMPGKSGMPGIETMHKWFRDRRIKYNAGAEKGGGNRAVYGTPWRTDYAYQLIDLKLQTGPVEMDCTTYVNMMLSIYTSGNIHNAPYQASCANFGGVSNEHCARDRYLLPLVRRTVSDGKKETKANYFGTAEQIEAAVKADSNGLYALEVAAAGSGSVTHMVLLHDGTVYECTTGQSGAACIDRSLADFAKNKVGKIFYLFGPSPTRR